MPLKIFSFSTTNKNLISPDNFLFGCVVNVVFLIYRKYDKAGEELDDAGSILLGRNTFLVTFSRGEG
jgi:hypothetical protein